MLIIKANRKWVKKNGKSENLAYRFDYYHFCLLTLWGLEILPVPGTEHFLGTFFFFY